MKQYAEIDVSLEASHVCIVDGEGKIIREAKVLSEPETLIGWFAAHGYRWSGSASKPELCHNGYTRPCARQAWRRS